jgi:fucose permease
MGAIAVIALRGLLPAGVDEVGDEPTFAIPAGPIIGLSILAFFSLVGEGAAADWSAVYMRNFLGAGPGLAAAGFAAFSLMMAVGRLTGDRLVKALGPARLVRASAVLGTIGLGAALLLGQPLAAIAGFACLGLGLSNIIPVLFSAASRTPGVSPGAGIAAVATTGYLGFLAGPPLIGFAAEATTLPVALGIVVLFTALVAVFAYIINRTRPPTRPASEQGHYRATDRLAQPPSERGD